MTYSLPSHPYELNESPALGTGEPRRAARPQLVIPPGQTDSFPHGGIRHRSEPCHTVPALIGKSPEIESVRTEIELVANRSCTVLIEGETGTGKEVVARGIHSSGGRSRGPWVAVNCGAIPEAMLEAELFGHVRGAFTGAIQSRAGKFEVANRGTIFLDEITEMPIGVQAKLLRVLQERELERVGANERIRLDVRVIAATNAGLADRVRRGLFREDLFYRLNVFRIAVPPLRERNGDIAVLAQHFLDRICRTEGCAPKTLESDAARKLVHHAWPGNVRELENVIEAATILSADRKTIAAGDIRLGPVPRCTESENPASQQTTLPDEGFDFQRAVDSFEERLLTHALQRVNGNKTAAAEFLGLKRTTLAAKMRVLEGRLPLGIS